MRKKNTSSSSVSAGKVEDKREEKASPKKTDPVEKQYGIVIVDDEDDVRFLLKHAFLKDGYNVFLAENGLRLISILRSEEIDCILLDISMPWLSGYQICKSIKNDVALKHIKVIYVSGLIKKEDEKKCYLTGCDGIIRKPFKIQNVLSTVRSMIENG